MRRFAIALLALVAGCDSAEPPAHLRVAGGDAERGRALIGAYGCGACHLVPGVRGARGRVGPPLDGFAARTVIAGTLPNTPSNVIAWIRDPPSIRPQTAMPAVGAAPEEARHMAAYLYTLGAEWAARPVPGPPLDTLPEDAAARLEARARDQLVRYRWIDPEAGIVAIPIARAIELMAEQRVESGFGDQEP